MKSRPILRPITRRSATVTRVSSTTAEQGSSVNVNDTLPTHLNVDGNEESQGSYAGSSYLEEVWAPLRETARGILQNKTTAAPRSSFSLLRSRRSWTLYPVLNLNVESVEVLPTSMKWLLVVEKRSAFTLADANSVWQLHEDLLKHSYNPGSNSFSERGSPLFGIPPPQMSMEGRAGSGEGWTRASNDVIKKVRMLRRPPELLVILKHGCVVDYKAAARLRVGGLDVWPMHRLSMLVRGGIEDPSTKNGDPLLPRIDYESKSHAAKGVANATRRDANMSDAEQELAMLQCLLPRVPQSRASSHVVSAPCTMFELQAPYELMGDQPKAVAALCTGLDRKKRFQTLLGATGTGKTFMMANVIKHAQRPTLVLAPNKVLAAQLYNELSSFFPRNAVEYFVSFYDYYLPESYSVASDTCELFNVRCAIVGFIFVFSVCNSSACKALIHFVFLCNRICNYHLQM